MKSSRSILPTAVALLAAAALPSSASAGSWSAERPATNAGTAFGPTVAADARGRIAVGWVRQLRGARRAEVRRGTLRGFLRGPALVLDSTTGNLDGVTVALSGDTSLLAVAWRRRLDAAQRLRGATVSLSGTVVGPAALTAEGSESAYFPRWVAGGDGPPRLIWDRRTSSAGRALRGTGFGAPFALPGRGVSSAPAIAVEPSGTVVAVWTQGGRVLTASAPPGAAFGPTTVLSAAGYARQVQAVATDDGDVVAAWLSSSGEGNAILAAARPQGGDFSATVALAGHEERAFAPRLAATSAGEVLVAYLSTATNRGWGSARGVVRLRRLGGTEQPVGGRIRLSPDGVRAIEPALAHDGIGSALAAWTDSARGRSAVQAKRIAPGGITGPLRTLSRAPADSAAAPALAGANGQGVAAWLRGEDVRYSVYR
ncbi:MAG TPA: hypothetical protein VFZ89_09795 [Solirubrobacteraceae bacterium]